MDYYEKIVGGALFYDGRLLVMKRASNRILWPGVWEIPGGKLESGETYEKALEREFQEETEIYVKVVREYIEFNYNYGDEPAVEKDFIVEAENFDVKMDPREHTEYKWISGDEVGNLDANPAMKKSIKIAFEIVGT